MLPALFARKANDADAHIVLQASGDHLFILSPHRVELIASATIMASAPCLEAGLALELLLQTGHARSDAVRMGRQHIKSGKLSMPWQKTNVQFDIPLLQSLAVELELHPRTASGRPPLIDMLSSARRRPN
jgi:hypothetical protein